MRALLLTLLAWPWVTGCGGGFESPSRVNSLRVLAVKTRVRGATDADFTDVASGMPGGRVRLELFGVDGANAGGSSPRALQTAWFGGCHNPPTRQFYACYPGLKAAAATLDRELVSEQNAMLPTNLYRATANADLSKLSEGAGTAFEFELPENILSAAPRTDRDPIHFGVSFVFFAACAGVLEARPELDNQIPVGCVDPVTRKELGAKDFVTGFTTVYTYDGAVNRNPTLEHLTLGGVEVEGTCSSDADCAVPANADAGLARRCGEAGQCVIQVPRCVPPNCPKFLIEPELSSTSGEVLPGGDNEIIWANFYATAGGLGVATELLNDRVLGRIAEPGSFFTPPKLAIPKVDLWLTVDDQRGGTDYRHFSVDVAE